MALADVFKTTAPTTPGNIPQSAANASLPATPGTDANGLIPAEGVNTPSANPLDAHKNLWDTPTNADGTPIVPASTELFTVDAKQLQEAAGKIDFGKSIKPEQLAAITAGGEGATKALVEIINSTSQQVYAQSAYATTKIVEDGIKRSSEASEKMLAEKIKGLNLSESLVQENPAFSHPAAAPILSGIQTQIALKFPNASAAELKQMALEYLGNFATAIQAPGKAKAVSKSASKEMDWSAFIAPQ